VDNCRLIIEDPHAITPRDEAQIPHRTIFEEDQLPVRPQFPRRPDAERALMESGALLSLWNVKGPREKEHYVALATDVDLVKSTLSKLYGESLEVIQSKYTEQTFHDITTLLGEDESPVCSFGSAQDADGQMKVAATLIHLPSQLAHRLQQFPPDALSLEVLVRPL
jgi:hypothetical protein